MAWHMAILSQPSQMSSQHYCGHSSFNTEYLFPSENGGISTTISTVAKERDLGIVFDGDLKFTSHVNQIVMKANRV